MSTSKIGKASWLWRSIHRSTLSISHRIVWHCVTCKRPHYFNWWKIKAMKTMALVLTVMSMKIILRRWYGMSMTCKILFIEVRLLCVLSAICLTSKVLRNPLVWLMLWSFLRTGYIPSRGCLSSLISSRRKRRFALLILSNMRQRLLG